MIINPSSQECKSSNYDPFNTNTNQSSCTFYMNNTNPAHSYTSMITMTRADTLFVGMIPTIEQGLAMFHQPDNATMDVTASVRLGGALTPPNPQNAVIPTNLIPDAAIGLYGPAGALPQIGRYEGAGIAANYRAA
jgi:hypothetical protein